MRRTRVRIEVSVFIILAAAAAFGQTSIELSGSWRFELDRSDAGLSGRWFERTLAGSIRLPGSMAENGLGDDISVGTEWTGTIIDRSWFTEPAFAPYRTPGRARVPFWLTPVKTYVGAAWYQKEVRIPDAWKGKRVVLSLERCHWTSQLWIDGREAGERDSLGTPHVYDLTGLLDPGPRRLTIRVDNRIGAIDVGVNAHSVSDHTQTNWNGIAGRIALDSGPLVYLDDLRIAPDVPGRTAGIAAVLRNAGGRPLRGTIGLRARTISGIPHAADPVSVPFSAAEEETVFEAAFSLGPEAPLWDEFSPSVFELSLEIRDESGALIGVRRERFGLRDFRAAGTRFEINGRPVFLRGTLECAIFPRTGYPPVRKSEWLRIFGILKAHGLNHMRFHSWCPPEAAFEAADETGIYLYVECGVWTTVGDGAPIDRWLDGESERIVREYGNHPSFVMMSSGNEPSGDGAGPFLAAFVSRWKAKDARRLYTTASGWPLRPESDFHVSPEPRVQRWGEGLKSVLNGPSPQTLFDYRGLVARFDKPVISHETGQWCAYPRLREMPKYTGVLKPGNFEIIRDSLAAAGMSGLADDFTRASGRLQVLGYKTDIEAALRTPGLAGFELLDLHDFPGQGTAPVGVLDAFWEEKGYVAPAEFRRFCGPTVPLVRLAKMVFLSDETLQASVEAAHFGPIPIPGIDPEWGILDPAGKTLAGGRLPRLIVPLGNGIPLGEIRLPLSGLEAPARYTLAVRLGSAINTWNFWVYPARLPETDEHGLRVVRRLDDGTAAFLREGGRVILTAEPGSVRPDKGGDVAVGFSSIFWNTAWTSKQPPHTLGILCDPGHQALAAFPTDFHSDFQWHDAMSRAQAIRLEDFGPGFKPIVRIVDDWATNRSLGLIFEVGIGKGRLIVTGADLLTDAERRPEARQLLHSLKVYAASDIVRPLPRTIVETVRALFKAEAEAEASISSLEAGTRRIPDRP